MNESVNRAFLYGESVFTTMRLENGKIRDWEYHFERLKKGTEYLYGPFVDGEDWATHLRDRLETRLATETGNQILRLTLYREKERGLHPTHLMSVMELRVHLGATPFEPERWQGKDLKLRTLEVPPRPHWWPEYLKCGSYLETILAQKKFLRAQDDDLLFISSRGTVLESSVANVFVCRHDRLYTAPTGPRVLDGIMRRRVLEKAAPSFACVEEDETTLTELFKADGVFGTNSVRGLFLISRIDDHEITPSEDFLARYEKLKRDLNL